MNGYKLKNGYVNLWRKSLECGLLKNHKVWVFWTWCLLKASYRVHKQVVGYQEIELLPGQFIFGRKKAAIELGMSERNVRTCLDFLSKSQNLTIKTTNKFSIITICNWDIYQSQNFLNDQQKDQPPTNKRPTNDQQTTTNNKGNNSNKGNKGNNKDKKLFGEFVFLTDEEYQKLCEKFTKPVADDWIERLNEYAMQKAKKFKEYTSHYATILSWDRMKRERDESYGRQNSTNNNDKYHKRGGHAPVRDFNAVFGRSDEITTDEPPDNEHLE